MRIVLILALVALASAEFKSYEGYQQVQVVPSTKAQVTALRSWMLERQDDFWLEPRGVGKPVHLLVPPQQHTTIFSRLRSLGLTIEIVDKDVGQTVMAEKTRLDNKPRVVDLDDFNTYDEIMTWMHELAAGCPSNLECEVIDPGSSHEGRPMQVFHLRNPSQNDPPVYWIDSAIHAREWLAPATLMKIMDHMVNNYGSDSEVNELVDSHEWYFMPVMNPDGYEYTWTNDRMWRKNRRQNTDVGQVCYGTDLNRNFDYVHCAEGASPLPCTDTYCGPTGGSEPETQVVQGESRRIQGMSDLVAWITIHSYGYMWMFPWGNTVNHNNVQCERADDHDDMEKVAFATADAIAARHNTRWDAGTSCEVIYATTGGTDDYVKGVDGVKYAVCPELRGNGFVIQPTEIQPSFEEIWAGLVVMTGLV